MTDPIRFPAYRILTERLVIRCWHPGDAPHLQTAIRTSLENLKTWMEWAHLEPEPLSTKVRRLRGFRAQFDRDENYVYGIWDRDETQVLGGTGLHPRIGEAAFEIGYWIHQDHQRQGLAREATAALTRVAFELHQVDRIEIRCDPANTPSASVPARLGFTHEATLKRRGINPPDTRADRMIWTLFASDYPTTPAATTPLTALDATDTPLEME